ncbi:MAG: CdaR family protein [Gemmatimonadales bacterium]
MNWRGIFVENIGFKLSALVVVAILWVSVTADERQAQPVPTVVDVRVQDTSWVLVEGPEEVNTTFQGRNRELLGLLMDRPVVHVEVDSVTGERMRVPLPVDQVSYNRDLGVVPTFITPATAELRFEHRRSARVPVVPDVDASPAAGYTVVQPIDVEPESVTVRGPESWVESLTRISTRPVTLEDLSNTVIRDIPLDLPEGIPGVEADPGTVLVTVSLDSLVVREYRVPVRLTGGGSSFARAEPDSVTVSLRGVAASVEQVADSLTALTVDVAARPEEPYEARLRSGIAEEGPVVVALEPAAVTISPRS